MVNLNFKIKNMENTKLMVGKFKLSSDLFHGEYFYNSMKEAEQKAAELGWRYFQIEIVMVEF